MKEGNLASTGKKQNTRDYKIYKFVHSMRKAQGKKKKNPALNELKAAQKEVYKGQRNIEK